MDRLREREIFTREETQLLRGYDTLPSPEKPPIRPNLDRSDDKKRKIRRVLYSPENHLQVLFQMNGSVLPMVLPFCIVNTLWTVLAWYLQSRKIVDLTLQSSTAHSFMGLLVSFLIVSRCTVSYKRFMRIRNYLSEVYRCSREIVQHACVYTYDGVHASTEATIWRSDVAYRTIILLRLTMDTLRWSSEDRDHWERPYQPRKSSSHSSHRAMISAELAQLAHGSRTEADENFRAPLLFSFLLREVVMKHPVALGYKMPVNEYRDLMGFITSFNQAFHGFRSIIFTPYPFPLVQMSRIVLFFWVYSMPLVLLNPLHNLLETVIIIFMATFGFIGTEYVSVTLDDPFGRDSNDFDKEGMAELVYEDIYLTIYRTDGPEAAKALRDRVLSRYQRGRSLDCFRSDLNGSIWENMFVPGNSESVRSH